MTTVRVGPQYQEPSHDISLEYGGTKYGFNLCDAAGKADKRSFIPTQVPRTAQKIAQGGSKYADLRPPYFSIAQDQFSGGRGLDDYHLDVTCYADNYRCDPTRGDSLICGPKATNAWSFSIVDRSAYDTEARFLFDASFIVASHFTPSTTRTVRGVLIDLKTGSTGTGGDTLITISIRADSAGSPSGSDLATCTVYMVSNTAFQSYIVPLNVSVTGGTKYWLCAKASNDAEVYFRHGAVSGSQIKRYQGGSWAELFANKSLSFDLDSSMAGEAKLFEYKGQLYAVTRSDDFVAPKLFRNGYRGAATSNAGELSKTKTTLSLSGVDLAGKIIKIVSGAGSQEETNWRVIVGNSSGGSNDYIGVNPSWNIAQDTTTEFVVLGADAWTEIGTTGLTKPVTSVLVVNDVVYFAQGPDTNIRRFNYAAGSNTFADDGTNKADFLALIPTGTGTHKVWKALAQTCIVSSAPTVTWATNLTFTDSNNGAACGSTNARITNLIGFEDGQETIPFILKEDSVGSIKGGIYSDAQLSEMRAVASFENGRAALVHDVYLYFSLLKGVDRYTNNALQDMGPNRDEGLPATRQGPIYTMVGYPGRFYAAVDGGSGYSSILCYTGGGPGRGWHEIYRSPASKRIRSMYVQVIPGDTVDRLWFTENEAILYLPISPNPLKQTGYKFYSDGEWESGWYNNGRMDTKKTWTSVRIHSENLSNVEGSLVNVGVEYKVDADTAWTEAGTIVTSPDGEVDLTNASVVGSRFKVRLTLHTDDDEVTPVIRAVVISGIEREEVFYDYTMNFLLADEGVTLDGEDENTPVETKYAKLAEWRNNSYVLTMHTNSTLTDNKKVILQSVNWRPNSINEEVEVDIATANMIEA